MTSVVKYLVFAVLAVGISALPAHAIEIAFTLQPGALGACDKNDVACFESTNEANPEFFDVDTIDLIHIGKFDDLAEDTPFFDPAPGFETLTPTFVCLEPDAEGECTGAFKVILDLGDLDAQLVKIVVKAGQALEDFTAALIAGVEGDQTGIVVRLGQAASHIDLFIAAALDEERRVPGPASVLMLGVGLVGMMVLARQPRSR